MSLRNSIPDRVRLVKPGVSLWSAAACLLGYAVAGTGTPGRAALIATSLFLLTGGAASLNNYQDRDLDARMDRTRDRPLPAHRLRPGIALGQAIFLLAAGLAGLCLWSASGLAPGAGLLALGLYNGVYTRFKTKTRLAFFPGVLSGALPPVIGWLAAGGGSAPVRILYVALLFAVWQVPHLWLLVLANRGDYGNGAAPSILQAVPEERLPKLIIVWVAVFAFLTLFLKPLHLIDNGPAALLVLANAVALPAVFGFALRKPRAPAPFRRLFQYLNAYTLGVTLLVTAEALGFF